MELDVRFNILFMFFIGVDVRFSFTFGLTSGSGFTISTSLDLTSGSTLMFARSPSSLSLQFSELNKLIFRLVPILKLGDAINILLLYLPIFPIRKFISLGSKYTHSATA